MFYLEHLAQRPHRPRVAGQTWSSSTTRLNTLQRTPCHYTVGMQTVNRQLSSTAADHRDTAGDVRLVSLYSNTRFPICRLPADSSESFTVSQKAHRTLVVQHERAEPPRSKELQVFAKPLAQCPRILANACSGPTSTSNARLAAGLCRLTCI